MTDQTATERLRADASHKELRGLQAENAKLRELVDELWALAYGYVYDESELDRARELMRELGIEVES